MKGEGKVRQVRRPHWTAAALSAFVLFGSAAGEDLRSVLATVYNNNPTIQAEVHALRASRERLPQARAALRPQVSANLALSRSDTSQLTTSGLFDPNEPERRDVNLDTSSARLSVDQVLFAGFRNRHAIGQAQAEELAARARAKSVVQDVLLETVGAYLDVVRDAEAYRLNEAAVSAFAQRLEDTEVLLELGDATGTDVLRARAGLANAEARLAAAAAQLSAARARYRSIVGELPGTLTPITAQPTLPTSLEAALSYARENAPGVVLARQAEISSRRQIGIVNAARLPEVSLTGSYERAEEPSIFLVEDETLAYGVRMRVPLWNGGATSSRLREAKALNSRDRFRLDAARRSVDAQTTAAWERLAATDTLVRSAEAGRDASELALSGILEEARLDVRTIAEVLEAERVNVDAQVAVLSAERERLISAYTLLAVIGALTPDPGFRPDSVGASVPEPTGP